MPERPEQDVGRARADKPGVNDLREAIKRLASKKPVVCASGNNGKAELVYPASLPEVIAIGACNDRGFRSTYSQYGRGLTAVAPSNDVAEQNRAMTRLDPEEINELAREKEELENRLHGIPTLATQDRGIRVLTENHNDLPEFGRSEIGLLSIAATDNRGDFGFNYEPAGDYCRVTGYFGFGGTSAAAAQVAGVVALMLAANGDLKNKPEEIKSILRETANKSVLLEAATKSRGVRHEKWDEGFQSEFGNGLVDAYAACLCQ